MDLFLLGWWVKGRHRFQDKIIHQAANQHGLDPALIKAVVWQESRFNPKAKGKVGEIGLMQVGAAAAQEWAEAEKISGFQHKHLFDPKKNTQAGAWYLAKLLKRYPHTDDPLPYALADYNAGRRNVLRWNSGPASTNSGLFLEEIDFPTTKAYILAVRAKYAEYSGSE
jgi:soluble lytic murein transglycosylase